MPGEPGELPLLRWFHGAAASGWKLPVLAGVLLFAAYYSPLPFLPFVFLIPLTFRLDATRDAGARRDFRDGWLMGVTATFLGMHFWIVPAVEITWLAGLLWVLLSAALALRFGLTWVLVGRLRRRTGWSYGLLLPLCWVPLEWLEGSVPDLRMTADHLYYALARFPFVVQVADLVGPYGITALVLAAIGCFHDTVLGPRRWRRPALLALVGIAVAVLGYDAWAWSLERPSPGTVRVALVQPNVPLAEKREGLDLEQVADRLARQSREAAAQGAELIVWPESARPAALAHWPERPSTFAMPDVQPLARETGAAFLVGTEYARVRGPEDYDLYNAAVAVDAEGNMIQTWAAKVYLVPFVEATPFRALLGGLVAGRGGQWQWLAGTFEPGLRNVVIDVAGARIGVLVCYEELFPELPRGLRNAGAELQVLITNDAWWGRTAFQRYLVDALRLRAIESRTEIARVANTGISGFVDRRGRYRQLTPLFEEALEVSDVIRSNGRTVYDRTGDAVVGIAVIGLVAAFVGARRR